MKNLDAISSNNDEHRRTNGIQTVSVLSDNERSESMVDRRSENS
jgi:hypothetical protein